MKVVVRGPGTLAAPEMGARAGFCCKTSGVAGSLSPWTDGLVVLLEARPTSEPLRSEGITRRRTCSSRWGRKRGGGSRACLTCMSTHGPAGSSHVGPRSSRGFFGWSFRTFRGVTYQHGAS